MYNVVWTTRDWQRRSFLLSSIDAVRESLPILRRTKAQSIRVYKGAIALDAMIHSEG